MARYPDVTVSVSGAMNRGGGEKTRILVRALTTMPCGHTLKEQKRGRVQEENYLRGYVTREIHNSAGIHKVRCKKGCNK